MFRDELQFFSMNCIHGIVVLTDKLTINNTEVVIKVQWRLMIGGFKKVTYYAAVALLGQECSPKITPAGGKYQASACR